MNNNPLPPDPSGRVVVYEAPGGQVRVDIHLDGKSFWLTRRQMAEVFDTSIDNVSLHLKQIYLTCELAVAL